MPNVIIGTAGHVDHGKTCLISALTGIETDRLDEEKKRGITIELGFAYLDLPNGEKAGIVDVPGHEKFIKNMLAGAGGMDMVLLVIAADEGIMPQTKEHLDILSMLDIKDGIVVLTKSDMVEEDWLEFVKDDIKNELKGTFLETAEVIPVSSHTGNNIDLLKEKIYEIVENAQPKSLDKSFRVPVDRVFTVKGFGTVITGTMIEGTAKVGDSVAVYPSGNATKIRNIQVHGQNVDECYAGQRAAINLAKVKTSEVSRGDTLAQSDSMEQTTLLDVKLNVLEGVERIIEDRSKLHFYHGTKNILCRVVLLDKDRLQSKESCYAQLRLDESIAVKQGDRFIVRFYSPLETIGGGEILDANPVFHRKNLDKVVKGLQIKENGTPAEKVAYAIGEYSSSFASIEQVCKHVGMDVEAFKAELNTIEDQSNLVKLTDDVIIHNDFADKLRTDILGTLSDYHKKNPLEEGMKKDEFMHRMVPDASQAAFEAVLKMFALDETVKCHDNRISIKDFCVNISKSQQKIMDDLDKIYQEKAFSAPTSDDLKARYSSELAELGQVRQLMINKGVLIKINEQIYLHKEHLVTALNVLEGIQKGQGEISLGDFRDKLDTSRKYALPILEYFDKNHITIRKGDLRNLSEEDLQKYRGML